VLFILLLESIFKLIMIRYFTPFLVVFSIISCKQKNSDAGWENLLDKNLNKWEVFLGIPHKSVGIPGYENSIDIKNGKPLGLGNHKNVFSVIEEDGEELLKVTGEIFGSLNSKAEYENYHLKCDVKWGDKRWEPRLKAKRNNGILYHSIGEYGSGLWNTWMSSIEFEVEETNFGDFITINDTNVRAKCPAVKGKDGKYHYDPTAPLVDFCWTGEDSGRCFGEDYEKPRGQWNTVELISFNGRAIHITNGKVVMEVAQAEFFNGSKWIPMVKGKLQIQSEGAETYFKNIKIKEISEVEGEYEKYFNAK